MILFPLLWGRMWIESEERSAGISCSCPSAGLLLVWTAPPPWKTTKPKPQPQTLMNHGLCRQSNFQLTQDPSSHQLPALPICTLIENHGETQLKLFDWSHSGAGSPGLGLLLQRHQSFDPVLLQGHLGKVETAGRPAGTCWKRGPKPRLCQSPCYCGQNLCHGDGLRPGSPIPWTSRGGEVVSGHGKS